MIIDINAWTGHWNTLPIRGDIASVRTSLVNCGVNHICLSPLNAAFCPNQHWYNDDVFEAADQYPEIIPVPVIDPTLPTWQSELSRVLMKPCLHLIKLLPSYVPYDLSEAHALFEMLSNEKATVIIQTRIDDPRHQHPLAQAQDTPVEAITDLAEQYPQVAVIAGGPTTTAIRSLKDRLLALPNLYVDVSQADGMDGIVSLVEAGLTEKLLFGSHAPLFMPFAALARVINDLDDEVAAKILGGNAERLLGI